MRFTDSPYEDFMKEKSYFKGVPPNLPPKGSRCDGCLYWHGIGCVFCYREQLRVKTCLLYTSHRMDHGMAQRAFNRGHHGKPRGAV